MNRIDIGNCRCKNSSASNGGAAHSLGSLELVLIDSVFEGKQAIGRVGCYSATGARCRAVQA